MCGIVGMMAFTGAIDAALLDRQRDALSHRGPDSAGSWISDDQSVGLAHRRLAIIDLSPGGHQPMHHSSGQFHITFNGEIYNYKEIRSALQQKGHSFRSLSDTEVILAAYAEWGDECVTRLNGMFAFGIYDSRARRLFLARDRAGEKPLYYRITRAGISFASEMKALLVSKDCPRRVSARSLNEYLAYGYVSGESTLLKDIFRVPAATSMSVDQSSATVARQIYWKLPETKQNDSRTLADAAAQLGDLLATSVRRQSVADVPLGILLSGGVDSSIITAIAAAQSSRPVRTFTVRFGNDARFDEGPFARLVAKHVGSEHTELEAQPADEHLLRKLVAQFDDPIADSSMIPTFLVSQEIRKHATVALGGDGGDELFGGYSRYSTHLRQERLRRSIPRQLRQHTAWVAKRVLPEGVAGIGFLAALADDSGGSLANAGRIFRDDERPSLSAALSSLSPFDQRRPELERRDFWAGTSSVLQRAAALDFSTYLPDDVLLKVDRASMLASLEVRAPFLDASIIDFAFSQLPDDYRATETDRKIILRLLGKSLLPQSLDLTRKQGFSIPVDTWMRGPWKATLAELISDRSPSLVSSDALARYNGLLTQGRPVGGRLYALMFLRLWERHYDITDVV